MMTRCSQAARTAALALLLACASVGAAVPASRLPALQEVAGRYIMASSSSIAFSVDQVGGGGIRGAFQQFSGSFNLKSGDLRHSSVRFELKPASVSTGQARIDAFLRSNAVFDSDHYGTISFRSDSIEQTGPDTARITGTLRAKGHTSRESFDAKLTAWTGRTITFSVSGGVFRSRYAMDVGTPIYSNVVAFSMVIRGERS